MALPPQRGPASASIGQAPGPNRHGEAPLNAELDQILVRLGRADGIWYQPNPGNAGDSLLAVAARQKFHRLGLAVHDIGAGFDSTGKVVVYGGGGNLVRHYRIAADFLEAHHERARHLLVLPHSVEGNEGLLARLGSNTTIVCRERISYEHCRNCVTKAEILLGHDLAIETELDRLEPWAGSLEVLLHGLRHLSRSRAPFPERLRYARKIIGTLRRVRSGRGNRRLVAFRNDFESTGRPLPPGNLDISELFMFHDATGEGADLCVRAMMGFLSRHDFVATDRLHVAIAAGLLGLGVELRPNNYFKCAAVWEHSLRDRFPNIRWSAPEAD